MDKHKWTPASASVANRVGLFEHFDCEWRGDFHFRTVIGLDPAADADAFAGKSLHIEFRRAERPHVFGRYRHREVRMVIWSEIDVGAAPAKTGTDHRAFDDLERTGAALKLSGREHRKAAICPMARFGLTPLPFGLEQRFGARSSRQFRYRARKAQTQ